MNFVTSIIENEHRQPTYSDAIKYGMKLQEKKDEETIELAEDHAMFAGMNKMEEQMMAKAIDAKVCAVLLLRNNNEVHYSVHYPIGELPHKDGEKVKVIIIKDV